MKRKTDHRPHRLMLWMLALALCLAMPEAALAFPPAEEPLIAGIDVSVWQGAIDFEQVKSSGVEIVYIRAGQGDNHTDPWLERHYAGAKAAGMKIGFYHFVTARNVEDARKQARFFVSLLKGKEAALCPIIDVGDAEGLSDTQVTEIVRTFLEEVEALSGQRGGIYIDASGARDILGKSLTEYPLWVANYEVKEPGDNGKWTGWAGWQYTNKGRVPGIQGDVDRDWFNKAMFLDEAGKTPEVEPSEQDNNLVTVIVRRGDTLSKLAREYGATVTDIARLNDLPDPNRIRVGQRLIIRAHESAPASSTEYIVKKGDTLSGIAARFGTTVSALQSLNGLPDPNRIRTGQRLRIAVSGEDRVYVVRQGDTLSAIARQNRIPLQELIQQNGIRTPDLIYPGQRIRLR